MLRIFPGFMKGHAVQFQPHLDIPFCILVGYLLGACGTFDLIRMSLILVCLLKAVIGGSLKTFEILILGCHGAPMF